MIDHTPVPEFRERWNILAKGGYTEAQIQTALESILFVFGRMDEELAKRGPWLAGATFSLGDISMLAIVHRVTQLAPDKLDRKGFPRLLDWWDRAMARPAAKWVYADNTEESPKRPPTKSVAGIAEYRI